MNAEVMNKTLTGKQARALAFAVTGIEPSLKLYNREEYQESIDIDDIRSIGSAGQLGFEIDFTFSCKLKSTPGWLVDGKDTTRYQLLINYWDVIHNRNPALLGLFRRLSYEQGDEFEAETLANVTVVTDLLRKWAIW